ncbi:MAG TPA: hypothetical protein VFR15_13050, partial [Chloroflexia bacterium]|nr:hypothetical protein [Chloroflexia bacterium]
MQANLKRTAPAIALTLAILLGVALGLGRDVAYAADGDLDFMITTDFAGGLDEARAVAVQPDGKVVAVGSTQLGGPDTSDFALARYNSDSSLDTAFGNGGRVTTDFFGGDDVAHDVAVQPDGKIVAAGAAHWPGSNSSEFAVARYNPDGSPDVTFGNSGRVTLTIQGSIQNAAYSIALQPDGRIVLAGHTLSGFGDPRFGLARLN